MSSYWGIGKGNQTVPELFLLHTVIITIWWHRTPLGNSKLSQNASVVQIGGPSNVRTTFKSLFLLYHLSWTDIVCSYCVQNIIFFDKSVSVFMTLGQTCSLMSGEFR